MSTWRVERHYGFGAAQIPIRAEPHASPPLGLLEGAGFLFEEVTAGGPVATMRRLVGQAPAMLLGLLLMLTFIITLTQDRSDRSPIEVVLFEPAPVLPEPVVIPEEIPVEPPEALPPPPVEVAKPKPVMPRPQQLAERPKPPPPPEAPPMVRPKPKPKPRKVQRPKPIMPEIARVETPKPPAQQRPRPERPLRDRPDLAKRPKLAIDATPVKPSISAPEPRAKRVARVAVDRTTPTRAVPSMAAPAAPAPPAAPAEPTRRSFRVATARPTSGPRPRALPGLAPVPRQPESTPAATQRASRRPAGPRPKAAPNAPRLTPALDRAPTLAAVAVPIPETQRTGRPAPTPATRRVARPTAALTQAKAPRAVPAPALASRAGRDSPTVPRGSREARPGLAGVPLGDLAACMSDREEDRLKQAVVAAVTTQEECVSSKGTYRFIETKNLNSFLMWIDRSRDRAVSDRCVELGYALECLESASRRAAR